MKGGIALMLAGLKAFEAGLPTLGYDVLISQQWELDEAGLQATISILNNQSHTGPIWHLLHERYRAEPAFDDPVAGRFYRLHRAP